MHDPIQLFKKWFATAEQQEKDANAMFLATVDPQGKPSNRVVLLKHCDDHGFVFYTNFRSQKAQELLENPHAAITFYWPTLYKQVRIEGVVETVSDADADAYFQSRLRDSQIGAWASQQSSELSSMAELRQRVDHYTEQFLGKPVPRPDYWSGFRLIPSHIEFWEGAPARLHQRVCFERQGSGWRSYQVYP